MTSRRSRRHLWRFTSLRKSSGGSPEHLKPPAVSSISRLRSAVNTSGASDTVRCNQRSDLGTPEYYRLACIGR